MRTTGARPRRGVTAAGELLLGRVGGLLEVGVLGQAPEREPGGHRPEHEGARTVAGEAASVVDEPIEAALLEPLALLAELLGGGAGELGDGRVGVVGGVGHGAELAGDAVERGGQVLGLALG
ncbi:MAG TPA: hypothetical protein VGE43_17480, partial [Acidimicrobiales bacterium]